MLYKIRFKTQTSFITELKSSTIFGALCCAVADKYGSDFLGESLKEEEYIFAVTDCLYEGYVPLKLYSENTSEQMIKHIETGELMPNSFDDYKIEYCTMSRDTGTSSEQWNSLEKFTSADLYIVLSTDFFSKEEIKGLVEIMFLKGIGKYRSRGKGSFQLLGIEEITYEELSSWVSNQNNIEGKCNGYMVLSDYIPKETESTDGVYSARIINGKTVAGKEKAPVYVINSGSYFKGDTNGIVGRLEYDEETKTYTGGVAIAVPIHA